MVGGRDRARTGDPLLAKQVLSQLSYTPTVGVTFILKHFPRFQNPFLRILVRWNEPLCESLHATRAVPLCAPSNARGHSPCRTGCVEHVPHLPRKGCQFLIERKMCRLFKPYDVLLR